MTETRILPATPAGISQAAELLRQHQPVAFPTETVYGLGARVFDEVAIEKIYQLKGRPSDNPLIAHIAELEQVHQLATEIPEEFWTLAAAFLPGPLTIVLQRKPEVPAIISAGLPTVAIRMPAHLIAQQLITAAGQPLVAPSANLSGKPSPTTAQHVLQDLAGDLAAVIDGGPTEVGIESTVLDLTQDQPVILRPGSISAEAIAEVLGQPVTAIHHPLAPHQPAAAPGMKYRHYAPTAHVQLFENITTAEVALAELDPETTLVLTNASPATSSTTKFRVRPLTAATLYAEFRQADADAMQSIVVILDPDTASQAGLVNRLTKASQGHDATIA